MNIIRTLSGKLHKIAAIGLLLCGVNANAEINLNYYSSLNGLKGAELKNAVHSVVTSDVKMLSYGSGKNKTWWGFYVTDRNDDNTVVDRYSNIVREFSSQGSAISGMNIEHSFAKSWWGGASNNAYKDLFNLMPCDASINSSKSNYVMGVCATVTTDNGCTKVGKMADGTKCWEPADRWKGDFARDYMYMATAYQDLTWETEGVNMLEQNEYPTLQSWASKLFIEWAKQDPVAQIEIDRNDNVQSIQGNRNPYVDFPNLMEYVWGDSINRAFNIYTTVKSTDVVGGIVNPNPDPTPDPNPQPDPTPGTIWFASFLGDGAGCTIEYAIHPEEIGDVWVNTSNYGWKASAANGSTAMYESVAYLITPQISLKGYIDPKMTFDHACKFADTPSAVNSVYVREEDGTMIELNVTKWPTGTNWTFVNSGEIDLSDYAGRNINIVFCYTSTRFEASTWEIKNLKITGVTREADFTVYFDNGLCEWTKPHIHYWGGYEESVYPGVEMTKVTGNIWSYTLPGKTTGVLFNAGDGDASKTQDFVAVNGHVYNHSGDRGVYDSDYVHDFIPEPDPETIWFASFLGNGAGCTVENVVKPSGISNVWVNTSNYGWKASAASGSTIKYDADSWLITPEIDLRGMKKIKMTFDHACKFAAVPSAVNFVYVRESDGTMTQLSVDKWPTGTDWTFVNSGDVDLGDFAGKRVNIVFRYTSTTTEASTWEIKNLTISAVKMKAVQGDINRDGSVNVADITELVNAIISGNGAADGFDVNGDGYVNVGDVTALVNIILSE